jgi:hypothetical protein
MKIEPGYIVKKDNQIYEITQVFGAFALGRAIKPDNTLEDLEVPLSFSDIEVIIEEITDAFNILFDDN